MTQLTATAPARRRRSSRRLALACLAAFVGVVLWGAVQDTFGWRDEMAALAASAAGPADRLSGPTAAGNALCFDVCRSLTVTYRTDQPAEQTAVEVADRMRQAHLTDVTVDCDSNVWCQVTGSRAGLVVTASQYRENAPYDLDDRRILTVVVGEVHNTDR